MVRLSSGVAGAGDESEGSFIGSIVVPAGPAIAISDSPPHPKLRRYSVPRQLSQRFRADRGAIETVIGRSSAVGSSSAANWLSRSCAGMK